jgi:tRNA dimethylallyltransferase
MSNTKKISPKNARVVAIVGPTGSGKTKLAKHLASLFDGKLISVDSRQIYKGMDIGTAKDKSFPQDLIDVVEPAQNFSLSDFQKMATTLVQDYFKLNKLPILVGGTGLYLDSVIYGYQIPELKQESLRIRAELEDMTDALLYKKLQELDPESAEKIDPRNKRRVVRALEYTLLNEKPFSTQQKKKNPQFKTLIIGIDVPRETLYAKVDARVEQMIKDGLVEEVRNLIKIYPADLPALNTIGYKEIINYLQGHTDLVSAKEKIKTNTHAYIRKQDTWFRRNKDVKWVKTVEEAEKLIKKFVA